MSSITREEMESVVTHLEQDPADHWQMQTLDGRLVPAKAFAAAIRALQKERDDALERNAVVERITAEVVPDNDALRAQLAEARQEVERLKETMRKVERQSAASNDLIALAMLKQEIARWSALEEITKP